MNVYIVNRQNKCYTDLTAHIFAKIRNIKFRNAFFDDPEMNFMFYVTSLTSHDCNLSTYTFNIFKHVSKLSFLRKK